MNIQQFIQEHDITYNTDPYYAIAGKTPSSDDVTEYVRTTGTPLNFRLPDSGEECVAYRNPNGGVQVWHVPQQTNASAIIAAFINSGV
jgi:hypothetical protein